MSIINEGKNVITCPGIILWDGITQPDTDEKTGAVSHNLKIAIPETAPEKAELEQLANSTLAASEFKGQFPAGGNWPIMPIDVSKLGDSVPLMAGRVAISAKTRLGIPPVYDAAGQELQAMQFGRMIYPGAVVKLLVHCYAFNNKSRGLAYGLDGIQIIDATAPKLDVGGGMSASQVGAAFAGTSATAGAPAPAPASAPAPAPVQPHHGFVANAGAPVPPNAAAPQHVMTPKANGVTYEAMIAAGWTDELLIQHGMMQG